MIDTHAHLDFPNFKEDFDAVLQRAEENNIESIVCVGIDEESCFRVVELADTYPHIWATVGVHPHDAQNVSRRYLLLLEELAASPQVIAIGETGLDYNKNRSPRKVQQKVFREQLQLAVRVNKPVVIHCRDAHEDLLKIIVEEGIEQIGGIMHCFSGDKEFARRTLDLGLYISFAGPVTYPKSHRLREVVEEVPLERILLETDCPFLAPQPVRGKRNEPAYVKYVYETVADLKGISVQELHKYCRQNLQSLTGITLP